MKIRDIRKKEWFVVDNIYINGYAKLVSPLTALTYFALCRHSNTETQECFPSMKLLAEELNISTTTVQKAIKELEKWNIISVIRSKKSDGTQEKNVYILLDKTVWKSKPMSVGVIGTDVISEGKPMSVDRCHQVIHKETHSNKTNNNKTQGKFNADASAIEANSSFEIPRLREVGGLMAAKIMEKQYWLAEGELNEVTLTEAEKFLDYYTNTGWQVGKVKMKNWRLAVGGWLSRWAERRKRFEYQLQDWEKENIKNMEGLGISDAKIKKQFNLK